MSDFLNSNLLRRIAGEMFLRWPSSLGWAMVGIPGSDAAAVWVHLRPYLHDSGMPPGFRVETIPISSFKLCSDPRYVSLFIRERGGDFTAQLYELMGNAQRQSLPWLVLEVSDDTNSLIIFEQDGSQKVLPTDLPPLRAREQRLRLNGSEILEVNEYLPLNLEVAMESPNNALSIELLEHSGFSKNSYHYVIRSLEAQERISGVLHVDAQCRAGKPDEILLRSSDFKHSVTIEEWETPPRTDPEPLFRRGTVFLHLLFDRTTLDVDAWPVAFEAAAAGGFKEDEDVEEAFGIGHEETANWNQQFRQALAQAMVKQIDKLHDEVQIYLWWFADTPKQGIAHSKSLPTVNEPYGLIGVSAIENITVQLSGAHLDYACGLDLFDAVDEALEQVANVVKERSGSNREQHAVLIVGDSPPPPSKPGDVLWEKLVDRPVFTSARCSDGFTAALDDLRRMQVPVAWLFMRTSRAPSVGVAYKKYVPQFQYFQSLRENILSALQQIKGLMVEGCAGPEDLERAMGKVLGRMARTKPRIPGLLIDGFRRQTGETRG
jgi:hypothetical protein